MNWLESVFGLSPDGGNGATEVAIAVALVSTAIVVAFAFLAPRLRRTRRAE